MTPSPDRLSNPYAVSEWSARGTRSRRAARALTVGALGLGAAGAFTGIASAQEDLPPLGSSDQFDSFGGEGSGDYYEADLYADVEAGTGPVDEPTGDPVDEVSEVGTPEVSEVGTPEVSEVGTPEVSEVGTPEVSEVGTPEVSEVGTPEVSEVVAAGPTDVSDGPADDVDEPADQAADTPDVVPVEVQDEAPDEPVEVPEIESAEPDVVPAQVVDVPDGGPGASDLVEFAEPGDLQWWTDDGAALVDQDGDGVEGDDLGTGPVLLADTGGVEDPGEEAPGGSLLRFDTVDLPITSIGEQRQAVPAVDVLGDDVRQVPVGGLGASPERLVDRVGPTTTIWSEGPRIETGSVRFVAGDGLGITGIGLQNGAAGYSVNDRGLVFDGDGLPVGDWGIDSAGQVTFNRTPVSLWLDEPTAEQPAPTGVTTLRTETTATAGRGVPRSAPDRPGEQTTWSRTSLTGTNSNTLNLANGEDSPVVFGSGSLGARVNVAEGQQTAPDRSSSAPGSSSEFTASGGIGASYTIDNREGRPGSFTPYATGSLRQTGSLGVQAVDATGAITRPGIRAEYGVGATATGTAAGVMGNANVTGRLQGLEQQPTLRAYGSLTGEAGATMGATGLTPYARATGQGNLQVSTSPAGTVRGIGVADVNGQVQVNPTGTQASGNGSLLGYLEVPAGPSTFRVGGGVGATYENGQVSGGPIVDGQVGRPFGLPVTAGVRYQQQGDDSRVSFRLESNPPPSSPTATAVPTAPVAPTPVLRTEAPTGQIEVVRTETPNASTSGLPTLGVGLAPAGSTATPFTPSTPDLDLSDATFSTVDLDRAVPSTLPELQAAEPVTFTPTTAFDPAPTPIVDLPAPVGEMPLVRLDQPLVDLSPTETPTPAVDVSTPVVDVPVLDLSNPVVDVSAPAVDLPVLDLPAPVVDVPAPVLDVPAPVLDVPAPVLDVPAPAVDVPAPVLDLPAPVLDIPAVSPALLDVPTFSAPAPVFDIPAVSAPTPTFDLAASDFGFASGPSLGGFGGFGF